MQVLANDTKKILEKYKQELLAVKSKKEKHQQNLQNLTKEIEKVSEELKSMGVKLQDTLESFCKQFIYLLYFDLFLPICFLFLIFLLLVQNGNGIASLEIEGKKGRCFFFSDVGIMIDTFNNHNH